ncbi:murein biosynthesis integral membrane protein MurJ [Corynebacterium striatum]
MTNENGSRRRIVTPTPPAPVPEKRVAPMPVAEDKSALKGEHVETATSDGAVVRATGSMAIATLISRITGFLRNVLIGSSLGPAISSAFTTANQLPNLITEIVLGAVLTSLVVPVLVRAEKEDADRGENFVRRLFTLAFTLLGIVTVASCIFAPQLTTIMLTDDGEVNATQATSFAYLLLPQIFFYGLFALFQAVLNTKNVFGPGAWAPVVNNIISIAVLVAYQVVPGSLHSEAPSPVSDPHVLLLALGTTLGVIVQCLILFPYLKKAGINLKPLWGLDDRLKQFGGMAMAIVAYVAVSQLGYIITSRIASQADEGAPFTYQQAWLLLQVPYGVIGVTLLTAIMPRLSRNAADGDVKAVVRDLTLGTKLTFIALIPIVIFMTGFGIPIARGLFQYGAFDADAAELLGLTLSFSAFTLIPYALVLLHLRVFYAREEAWTPTFIIAGITFTKVVLSMLAPHVADSPERVVILLGTANGFGFIAGAVIGGFLLKRKLGSLGGKEVLGTTLWATLSSVAGLVVAFVLNMVINLVLPDSLPPFVELIRLMVVGLTFVIATGLVLSRSGLPEVINLGRQLQRIPGMNRLIKIDDAEAIEVEEPEIQEIQPIFNQDAFNSSPVPPPMSAGIVRGPRLVPGAPVSDGRFRLLADYGSVPGARFWKAREQATGRVVSLTFVDTTGEAPMAPATPAVAARRSADVSRNTRKLAELGLEAVASNIQILSYRQGCLVVADWIEGTPLKTVAEEGDLDPRAVARALAPLVDAATTAHEHDLVLGIDNRNRIRIATDGVAKLAFPAVLERNSVETDVDGINSTITLLTESTASTPQELRDVAHSEQSLEERAKVLHAYANETEQTLEVREEKVETPEATPGFGGRGYSGSGAIILGVFATIFVVGMAALTAWIMSLVGEESPVTKPTQTVTSFPNTPPVLLKEKSAFTVPDNKEQKALVDGKGSARVDIAEGALVTLEKPTQLHVLQVSQYGSTGTKFTVYGVNTDKFDPEDPEGTELAKGKLSASKQDIELKKVQEGFDGVLIMFDGKVAVSELQTVGLS